MTARLNDTYSTKWFKANDATTHTADALGDAFDNAGVVSHDARSIGNYLMKHKGRTIDGLRLETRYDATPRRRSISFEWCGLKISLSGVNNGKAGGF